MLKKVRAVVCASFTNVCANLRGAVVGKRVVTGGAKSVRKRRRSGKEKKIGQKREMGSCRLAPDGDGSVVMRPC